MHYLCVFLGNKLATINQYLDTETEGKKYIITLDEIEHEVMCFIKIKRRTPWEIDLMENIYSTDGLCKFVTDYLGFVPNPSENPDHFISYINPDGLWDWYEVGGRFNNMLIMKNGMRASSAKKKEIDWNKTINLVGVKLDYLEKALLCENVRNFSQLSDKIRNEIELSWKLEYFTPDFVIDRNGIYDSLSGKDFYKNIIVPLKPNTTITLIDAHN